MIDMNERKISWLQIHCNSNYIVVGRTYFDEVVTEIKAETLNSKGQSFDEVVSSGGVPSTSIFHEYYTVYYNGSTKFRRMYPIEAVNVGFED